jgi:hypothetical protein
VTGADAVLGTYSVVAWDDTGISPIGDGVGYRRGAIDRQVLATESSLREGST